MWSFGLAMIQIAVAVTFSWAAAAKLASPNEFRRTLDESAMPRAVSHLAVIGVPSAEACIGTAAVLTRGPVLGAVLTSAAFLVVAFSIWAVGVIRAGRSGIGERVPNDLVPVQLFSTWRHILLPIELWLLLRRGLCFALQFLLWDIWNDCVLVHVRMLLQRRVHLRVLQVLRLHLSR